MATRLLSCVRTAHSRHVSSSLLLRRSFVNLGLPNINLDTKQHLTATRILPFERDPLYELIADVDSYAQFVPYCSRSRVTQWSQADEHGRRWPTLADLHVGWGGFDEVFTSKVRCIPGTSVEALSGTQQDGVPGQAASAVFKCLVTTWSLKELKSSQAQKQQPQDLQVLEEMRKGPQTEVSLSIDFQFLSPLYAAMSATVSDKVAKMMVEAFEARAKQKLGSKP